MTPAPSAIEAAVSAALARHAGREGPLLEVLHDVQHALGCVPPAAVPPIARALNLSRAEVHGVVTYYHHFRGEPPPAVPLQVCRAESCIAMGADELWEAAQALPGCHAESVYCLGLCAQSPAAMLGGRPLARLTPQKLNAAVQA